MKRRLIHWLYPELALLQQELDNATRANVHYERDIKSLRERIRQLNHQAQSAANREKMFRNALEQASQELQALRTPA